ncbi:MAG: hypothetical protein IJZ53_12020 [Tyzzerella sp.]|nr:hypothetical protein [Tyzzerella sp.]
MTEYWKDDDYCVQKEKLTPVSVKDSREVKGIEELLSGKASCVSFHKEHVTEFAKQGAYVVLDFGKEVCGGLRFVTRDVKGMAEFRITFGESLSECYTTVGEKNAGNDHALRDFKVQIPFMSDLTFGQSGFRFAKVELVSESPVLVKNIFAINTLPVFEKEGFITTSDKELNKIIETALYTLKLNFQNGYIWDGVKRDRLVWSGDLNQEIITSLYLFGDNKNITNSLSFLRHETLEGAWMNNIPSYSAWWVINLCDYCRMTGNREYFKENRAYAKAILKKLDDCIDADGTMEFGAGSMSFYLDWPTRGTEDAVIGTAALLIYAAKAFLWMEEATETASEKEGCVQETCHSIISKLETYLEKPCEFKQTRAFQILAGRNADGEDAFLEKNGADGYSTFMAYYILTADGVANGKEMLSIIKEYFGAMLSRGATTFWEDFHMDWLEGSGRIDELPKEGEKDIHGDYGAFCYKGFRHSLCHGWASGVLAFVIEYMLGLKLEDGGECYEVHPHCMGIDEIHAKIPMKEGYLQIDVVDGKAVITVVES